MTVGLYEGEGGGGGEGYLEIITSKSSIITKITSTGTTTTALCEKLVRRVRVMFVYVYICIVLYVCA